MKCKQFVKTCSPILLLILIIHHIQATEITVSECLSNAKQKLGKVFTDSLKESINREGKLIKNHDWQNLPRGRNSQNHINLITVRNGKRLNYLAFMIDSDGKIILASRVPALLGQIIDYRTPSRPGDSQIPKFAVNDLILNFAKEYLLKDKVKRQKSIQIIVKKWQHNNEMATNQKEELKSALPVAVAAVYKEGFSPQLTNCPSKLIFKINFSVRECNIHGIYEQNGQTVASLYRLNANIDDLYDECRILSKALLAWSNKLYYYTKYPISPLTGYNSKNKTSSIIGLKTLELLSLQADFKTINWVQKKIRGNYETSGNQLYEVTPITVSKLNLTNGTSSYKIKHVKTDRIAINTENIAISGKMMTCYQRSKQVWKKQMKSNVQFLLVTDKQVCYYSDDGSLQSVDVSNGKIQWKQSINSVKMLYQSKTGLYLLTEENVLIAYNPENGKKKWQISVGDWLFTNPVDFGNKTFIVSKTNEMILLNSQTGDVLQSKKWPTWILALSVRNNRILFRDLKGKFVIMDPQLKQIATLEFPFEINDLILDLNKVAISQDDSGMGMIDYGPATLVFDSKGYIYLFKTKPFYGFK